VLSVIDPVSSCLAAVSGQNQLVLPEVQRVLRSLAWDTEVTVGALGDRAPSSAPSTSRSPRALDRMA